MIYVCPICREVHRSPLLNSIACRNCYRSILDHRLNSNTFELTVGDDSYPVRSVMSYRGPVRDLILGAKGKRNDVCLDSCTNLLVQWDEIELYLDGVKRVIPAPSSAWSRLMGKYDLAYFMASRLSKTFDIPFLRLPSKYYWRMKKQSMIPREFREKHGTISPFVMNPSAMRKERQSSILIVDDVMTTGSTVASIIKSRNLKRVKVLTLASACKRGTNG